MVVYLEHKGEEVLVIAGDAVVHLGDRPLCLAHGLVGQVVVLKDVVLIDVVDYQEEYPVRFEVKLEALADKLLFQIPAFEALEVSQVECLIHALDELVQLFKVLLDVVHIVVLTALESAHLLVQIVSDLVGCIGVHCGVLEIKVGERLRGVLVAK